jgi:excisionase family DNA binding protein
MGKSASITPSFAFTVKEACAAIRTCRTTLYELIRSGELRAVKRGRRTLILAGDLERYIARLPALHDKAAHS